jgi:transposase
VLAASEGLKAEGIAAAVDKGLLTVRRWRRRFMAKGVDGLVKDATRPSRVKPLTPEKIAQVVHMTLQEKPPNATQWSVRSSAAAGISYSSVRRIRHAHRLKPHLVKTFKVSRDKNFVAKVEDVVGLYLNPPDQALVLCADRPTDADGPRSPLAVDNDATHKTPAVKRWIKAHPRFHLHFTPTSASWLNMVERFFAEITRNRIRRGAFKSVPELKAATMEYLENHNADPKPFIRTKPAKSSKRLPARNKR